MRFSLRNFHSELIASTFRHDTHISRQSGRAAHDAVSLSTHYSQECFLVSLRWWYRARCLPFDSHAHWSAGSARRYLVLIYICHITAPRPPTGESFQNDAEYSKYRARRQGTTRFIWRIFSIIDIVTSPSLFSERITSAHWLCQIILIGSSGTHTISGDIIIVSHRIQHLMPRPTHNSTMTLPSFFSCYSGRRIPRCFNAAKRWRWNTLNINSEKDYDTRQAQTCSSHCARASLDDAFTKCEVELLSSRASMPHDAIRFHSKYLVMRATPHYDERYATITGARE